MNWTGILILAVIVGAPLLVYLEGQRQRRRLEELGQPVRPFRGGDVVGAGLLHLQGLLQADRRVEVMQKKEGVHHQEAEPGGAKLPEQK